MYCVSSYIDVLLVIQVAVGDQSGVLQVFGMKKGEPVVRYTF